MVDRHEIRRLLWRWGRALEFVTAKQRELEGWQDRIEAQRDLSAPILSDMPKAHHPGNPTERAALKLNIITAQFEEVVKGICSDIEAETRFKRIMDELIGNLSGEQQKVLQLRNQDGHAWEFIALKMCYSVDRAKHIDAEAVEILIPQIEVSTF
jgi:hypothetical protein